MSEEWPNGWYRHEQGRHAQPGFTPRLDALGSPYEPTQAVPPGGAAWPAQPPARSRPGDGGPPRTRGPQGRRPWLRPKRPTLVSIPRDSYVPIPGHGENKINAAYSLGGPKLLIQTVQNVTGLRIDHYIGIGFGGLVDVVNDVGGVTLCLPGPMKDPKAGLNLKKGCQTLDGDQALSFVRTREFPLGDLQREQDQRALLKSLLSKMTSTGTLINPVAVIPAASGAASSLTIDQGTSLSQLASVAFALKNPVTTMVPFGGFGNTSAGSVVEWNVPEAKVFFNDLATDKPLPKNLITGASVAGTT